MIKAITYETLIKTLGKFLDDYSGLNPNRILNAISIRGTDLAEMINSTEYYSPEASTSFLLFELIEKTDGDHFITIGEKEGNMMTIQSYLFHLKIYGNSAPTDAQKISTLFKKEDIVLNLRNEGIYINGVSPIDPINEFINNTLLLRRDLIITLEVRYEFENQGEEIAYFDQNQKVDPIVKNVLEINVN